MSKSSVAVLFVAIVIAVCGLSFGQAEQQEAAQPGAAQGGGKWEYKVVTLTSGSETAAEILNDAAAEGWELQECYQVSRSSRFITNAIMKRPAQAVAAQ